MTQTANIWRKISPDFNFWTSVYLIICTREKHHKMKYNWWLLCKITHQIQQTPNNCFRLKKCNIAFHQMEAGKHKFLKIIHCYFALFVLTCFRLTKAHITFFRLKTIVVLFFESECIILQSSHQSYLIKHKTCAVLWKWILYFAIKYY